MAESQASVYSTLKVCGTLSRWLTDPSKYRRSRYRQTPFNRCSLRTRHTITSTFARSLYLFDDWSCACANVSLRVRLYVLTIKRESF